jgi:hypothetical protein
MRVAIVHALFEVVGGDARLALDMYRALKDLGHEVDLYTAHVNEGAWRTLTGDLRETPRPITIKEPLASSWRAGPWPSRRSWRPQPCEGA